MKKNKITLLFGIILAAIALWFILTNKNGTIKQVLKDFAISDTSKVTKIFLADKNNHSVLLEKIKPGLWKVNNKYPARTNAINLLLFTMKNLDVKNPVGVRAQDNVVKKLAYDAIKVEIYYGDELVKLYYVGSETPDQLGTYMLLANPSTMENSSVPFIMYLPGFNGYLTPRYFTNESDWKNRVLFSYIPPDIHSIKIETPRKPELSFEIIMKDNKYDVKKLSSLESISNLDTMAVKQYLSFFQNIHYGVTDTSINKALKDSIMNSIPMNIISVNDIKDNINKVKLFPKPAPAGSLDNKGKSVKYDMEHMYALINNERDLVLVQYFVFGKLLPSVEFFQKRK